MWISLALALLLVGGIFWVLRKKELDRRKGDGPCAPLEYRTSLAFDECLDRLRDPGPRDLFRYTCRRERDGSFTLHFTAHQPTNQPLDTLYSLRLDSGKQTIVTLIFLREAFGYGEPVFPRELLDQFLLEKLEARPAQTEK